MNNELKLYFKEIRPKCGKTFYCLDIEESSIDICIQLLFRIFFRENGHLLRGGCSWLSLKKYR